MGRLSLLFICLVMAGCTAAASGMLIGGSIVKSNYAPQTIVASYTPLGNLPEGTEFFLVEHRGRKAVYRRDSDGTGMLMEYHWQENGLDYYSAAFFGNGPAYIAVIPEDLRQEGQLFSYEHGTYQGGPSGFRKRPTPYNPKTEPDVRLIPKG